MSSKTGEIFYCMKSQSRKNLPQREKEKFRKIMSGETEWLHITYLDKMASLTPETRQLFSRFFKLKRETVCFRVGEVAGCY